MTAKKPQRIVHFSSVHVWNDTRIFRRMCRSLARHGYDVHLVATCDDKQAVETHDGVTVHALPRPAGRFQRLLNAARTVVKKAQELDADLYHFHDPELIPSARRLAKRGHRVIYDAHEDLPHDIVDKQWLPPLARSALARPIDWIERRGARAFAAVITTEEAIEQRFRGTVPTTLSVHNYPELADFPPEQTDTERAKIVHFGGLSQLRCIEPIVDALGLLPEDLDAQFVAAGRCDSDALRERLKSKPGFARVNYVGWLSHAEMRSHLKSAAVAMNLYSDAPNHQTVRSNRFFESMAAGVPTITADMPKWKQLVSRLACGIPVAPDDPQAIADAIQLLLTNHDKADELGRNGRQAVEREYNWESEFEKMCGLYERILSS